jgi:hypothetical protein
MHGFIIEREIPNASDLSAEQLREIARQSCEAIAKLGKPYKWHHSYVAGDKFYCVHEAESEEVIREHARCGRFPTDRITRISAMIEPVTSDNILVRN